MLCYSTIHFVLKDYLTSEQRGERENPGMPPRNSPRTLFTSVMDSEADRRNRISSQQSTVQQNAIRPRRRSPA